MPFSGIRREQEMQQLSHTGASFIAYTKEDWEPVGLFSPSLQHRGQELLHCGYQEYKHKLPQGYKGNRHQVSSSFMYSWLLDKGILSASNAGVACSRASVPLCWSTGKRHQKHQINSVVPKEQLPANEIKISLTLEVSPMYISFLSAKYSALALSYLPASTRSSRSALLLLGAQWPSHLCSPHPSSALWQPFWEVSALIRSIITLPRRSVSLWNVSSIMGWSCLSYSWCQPGRMPAASRGACLSRRSPFWGCKAMWKALGSCTGGKQK